MSNVSKLVMTNIRIKETELCAWLAQAEPGDYLEYHRGFLCLDRGDPEHEKLDSRQKALNQVANRAFALAQGDFVYLVQRRLGPDTFSYRAIARPKPEGKALNFKTLMHEEAA